MDEMNKRTLTKRIVQAVAVTFGLLGLLGVVSVFLLAVAAIVASDRSAMFFMVPESLLFGGISVAIAWQNLRRFGPSAIKNVTCLVALVLWGTLASYAQSLESAITGSRTVLINQALFLIPLLAAIIFYRVVSKKLIQITETQSRLPELGRASCEAAPSGPPGEPST